MSERKEARLTAARVEELLLECLSEDAEDVEGSEDEEADAPDSVDEDEE